MTLGLGVDFRDLDPASSQWKLKKPQEYRAQINSL